MRDTGPQHVVDVASAAGVASPLTPNYSLALGTSDVTALDMATGYATFAREGDYLSSTGMSLITDASGNKLYENDGNRVGHRVVPASVADSVIEAMTGVVEYGTGTPARVTVPASAAACDLGLPFQCDNGDYVTWGKTGTTEDHADAWFVGGVGGYVAAVWVGHPEGRIPMRYVHGISVVGASFPAKIWKTVMTAVIQKYRPADTSPTAPSSSVRKNRQQQAPPAQPSDEPKPTAEPTQTQQRPRGGLLCPPVCSG
jgi:penicillin-binding protein 1A